MACCALTRTDCYLGNVSLPSQPWTDESGLHRCPQLKEPSQTVPLLLIPHANGPTEGGSHALRPLPQTAAFCGGGHLWRSGPEGDALAHTPVEEPYLAANAAIGPAEQLLRGVVTLRLRLLAEEPLRGCRRGRAVPAALPPRSEPPASCPRSASG